MKEIGQYADERTLRFAQTLPQFVNMTVNEIDKLLQRIDQLDEGDWQHLHRVKLKEERVEDSRYMEDEGKKDPILPDGNVCIEKGIMVTFATVDKNGFASTEDLAKCKKTWKLSLTDTKRIYL